MPLFAKHKVNLLLNEGYFLMLGNYKARRCCFYQLDDWHKSGIRKEAEWFGDESVLFGGVLSHATYTYLYPNGNRNKESHSKFRSDMLIWPCGLLRKDTNGPINWLPCARIHICRSSGKALNNTISTVRFRHFLVMEIHAQPETHVVFQKCTIRSKFYSKHFNVALS